MNKLYKLDNMINDIMATIYKLSVALVTICEEECSVTCNGFLDEYKIAKKYIEDYEADLRGRKDGKA